MCAGQHQTSRVDPHPLLVRTTALAPRTVASSEAMGLVIKSAGRPFSVDPCTPRPLVMVLLPPPPPLEKLLVLPLPLPDFSSSSTAAVKRESFWPTSLSSSTTALPALDAEDGGEATAGPPLATGRLSSFLLPSAPVARRKRPRREACTSETIMVGTAACACVHAHVKGGGGVDI